MEIIAANFSAETVFLLISNSRLSRVSLLVVISLIRGNSGLAETVRVPVKQLVGIEMPFEVEYRSSGGLMENVCPENFFREMFAGWMKRRPKD